MEEFIPKIEFEHEESKWAWLAGLFDGEGHVSLQMYTGKGGSQKTKWGFHWNFVFNITNESKEIIETVKYFIKKELEKNKDLKFSGRGLGEGSITCAKRKEERDSWKYWLGRRGMEHILPKMMPYLIVKRQNAKLVMEAIRLYRKENQVDTPRLRPIFSQLRELTSIAGKKGRKRKDPTKIKDIIEAMMQEK